MTLGFLFYKISVLSVSVLVTFKIKWVHTKPPCPSVYPLLPAEGASVEQVAPQHLLSTSQPLQQLLGRRAQRTSAGVLWWSHDDVVGILLQMTELGLLYMQSCWLSVCLSVRGARCSVSLWLVDSSDALLGDSLTADWVIGEKSPELQLPEAASSGELWQTWSCDFFFHLTADKVREGDFFNPLVLSQSECLNFTYSALNSPLIAQRWHLF